MFLLVERVFGTAVWTFLSFFPGFHPFPPSSLRLSLAEFWHLARSILQFRRKTGLSEAFFKGSWLFVITFVLISVEEKKSARFSAWCCFLPGPLNCANFS